MNAPSTSDSQLTAFIRSPYQEDFLPVLLDLIKVRVAEKISSDASFGQQATLRWTRASSTKETAQEEAWSYFAGHNEIYFCDFGNPRETVGFVQYVDSGDWCTVNSKDSLTTFGRAVATETANRLLAVTKEGPTGGCAMVTNGIWYLLIRLHRDIDTVTGEEELRFDMACADNSHCLNTTKVLLMMYSMVECVSRSFRPADNTGKY